MNKSPTFSWNKETSSALCILYNNRKAYYGSATCSPEDQDMISEKVGCEIAYHRALIAALRAERNELAAQYKGIHNCYYTMNTSKWFNETGYEAQRMQHYMQMLQEDLETIKSAIKYEQEYLYNYIKDKEAFYQKIRANRQAVNSN